MRSPTGWSHYNFPGSMYGHSLSPTSSDSYGSMMHNNNNYNQQGLPLSIKSGHSGSEIALQGSYNDPRMFSSGQLSHSRTSPTNSTGGNSPPQSLSNPYHHDATANSNGLGGTHSFQNSNIHGNPNPAHSFLGTNSVTINNNYLMNVSPSGSLNLPFKSYNTQTSLNRTVEEDANNNNTQLGHFYRQPPALYEAGPYGYQSNLKHAYDSHMTDHNGNVNHHGEDLDDSSTPKVWRPY